MNKQTQRLTPAFQQTGNTSQGKFQFLPQQVRVDFEDGSAIVAPAGETTIKAASVASTFGDIINIACKLFPSLCEVDDGNGGGESDCYIIISPDGTKITVCRPPRNIT